MHLSREEVDLKSDTAVKSYHEMSAIRQDTSSRQTRPVSRVLLKLKLLSDCLFKGSYWLESAQIQI